MVNQELADKYSNLKTDLRLRHHNDSQASLFLEVDNGDLVTCDGRDNLAQVIWLRLAISRGELAPLGHKSYGSRLHNLIGQRISRQTIDLAKAYIREALRDEGRIKEVVDLEVFHDPNTVNVIKANFRVIPQSGDELNLQFSQSLA